MLINTKMLIVDYTDNGKNEYWENFCFDLKQYVAHAMEGDFSEIFLSGLPHSIVVQLSFEELTAELEIFNTFETVSLN